MQHFISKNGLLDGESGRVMRSYWLTNKTVGVIYYSNSNKLDDGPRNTHTAARP